MNERTIDSPPGPPPPLPPPLADTAEAQAIHATVVERLFGAVEAPPSIGRFVVLRVLGQGGMGRVYAAYDEQLDRRVAIKVLRRDVQQTSRQRVLREAQAMAKLSHPHVVPVFEVGEHQGRLYIAMEFIEGQPLGIWQVAPERTRAEILAVYQQAGRGLAAAHAAGLIHRDFKPHNVMVDTDADGGPRARVLDFGVARLVEPLPSTPDTTAPEAAAAGVDPKLTATGSLVGTPAYMAPEQFTSADVDPAADQFSFCVALWEALYGERPFEGDSVDTLARSILAGTIRAPSRRASVPGFIRQALTRGLSRRPEDRHRSMGDLLAALYRDPARARTRLLRIGLGVLAGAGGLAGLLTWTLARAERCTGSDERLQGVWDDAQRSRVHQAFGATAVPYAEATWARTASVLDDYAQAWVEGRVDACTDTTIRSEQSAAVMDLRMACLRRARGTLAEIVRVLGAADSDVVEHAPRLLAGLEPLDRCADVPALQADVEPPRADEVELVEQIRAGLARAEIERLAGHYAAAQQALDQADGRLAEVRYGPVQIEVALQRGHLQQRQGDYAAAETALRQALEQAATEQQWEAMQEAASALLSVVGKDQQRPQDALRYREIAKGLARTDAQRAALHNNLGALHKGLGEFLESEAEYHRALELYVAAFGEDHPDVAITRHNLASTLEQQGRYPEAEAAYREALAGFEAISGPDHPLSASFQQGVARILKRQGRYVEAKPEFERALASHRRALGPHHPSTLDCENDLASLSFDQGELAEAEQGFARVLQARLLRAETEPLAVAQARNNLAIVLNAQGRYVEAEAEHRHALATKQQVLGADHPKVAMARGNLGIVLRSQGRYAEAEVEQRHALADLESALGPDHLEVAIAYLNLATPLKDQGKLREAEQAHRRGLERLEAHLGSEHPHVVGSRMGLASLLLVADDAEAALPIAEQAWAQSQQVELPPIERAKTGRVLAKALWATAKGRAQRERALAIARQALELAAGDGETLKAERALLQALLDEHS